MRLPAARFEVVAEVYSAVRAAAAQAEAEVLHHPERRYSRYHQVKQVNLRLKGWSSIGGLPPQVRAAEQ